MFQLNIAENRFTDLINLNIGTIKMPEPGTLF